MNKTLKELGKKYKESMKRKNKIPTGLEALDNLRDYGEWLPSLEIGIIRRELKVLEIIKEKKVCVVWLKNGLSAYNSTAALYELPRLTEEEYDLLKEVLLWD